MRNQPPVSMTSRLPSASSSTSVGWKSGSSAGEEVLARDREAGPVALEDVPLDAVRVELGARRACRGSPAPNDVAAVPHEPGRRDPAEVADGAGAGRRCA